LQSEIPAHTHGQSNTTVGSSFDGDTEDPAGAIWAKPSADRGLIAYDNKSPNNNQALMSPAALSITGGSLPHNNMQPYLALNFCIALQGIYPARP
jgi:microcystin-dependent protein